MPFVKTIHVLVTGHVHENAMKMFLHLGAPEYGTLDWLAIYGYCTDVSNSARSGHYQILPEFNS